MPSARFYGLLSTVLLVVGALAVGQALHLTVVTGQVTYASPAFVLQFGVGLVLIALGYRARRPVAESYGLTSDERADETDGASRRPRGEPGDRSDAGAEDGFDPELSPLGDTAPGDAERERTERGDGEGAGGRSVRRDGETEGEPSDEPGDGRD